MRTATADLRDFGIRELRLAAELLNAYCDGPPSWMGKSLALTFNRESGNVFLTDEDFNVAMMNGSKLDAWLFTPHEGYEGFIGELTADHAPGDLHADDADHIRHWADVLGFVLPASWREDEAAE